MQPPWASVAECARWTTVPLPVSAAVLGDTCCRCSGEWMPAHSGAAALAVQSLCATHSALGAGSVKASAAAALRAGTVASAVQCESSRWRRVLRASYE